MPTFKFTPKDIYEADFSTKMRGYDKEEVDELLDDIIADYETYQTETLRLQEENEFLKKKIAELEMQVSKPNQANLDDTQRFDPSQVLQARSSKPKVEMRNPSNFDLLKRINRLEQAVFGPNGIASENN
ncbi:putative DivIVA cell division initiation protein [Lactococcus cremoris subsp. cremoris UC509.9]|uniref:Cell division regulator GpsB n=1 Tax=Lactococcus lactis subsp. cremoris TaxID=1359 RepID=A0AAJ6N2Z2_LACLC|nr:cell division regulator GpsB [Lactococcus cremoris]AFW92076.1 putative DivIVA cell division initiation protein [Lactococcus cremoris subsp. cremoris UC509.9]ARD91804.1 cell division regulator GpsB [Lactococcus cremoris]MRM69192.1 cell division regulator GpsB [Lactococcus cremoris]QJD20325.1 cell division regulator GpsB [Lactococcus cremoris]QRZ30336.1 DivIVA cell division initiation protein [Lactococcus cremoris]